MKKIIVNSQWQGGADLITSEGAKEIMSTYLDGTEYINLPVSLDQGDMTVIKNNIKGFDVLYKQMHLAYTYLSDANLDKIFMIGGGCDADVPAIVYLSEKNKGDLTVLWLDAHGDLNAPQESTTGLFYGMLLRSVMDDFCFGLLENPFPLHPSQIIHIGGRNFDEAEISFIQESGMQAYSVQDIRNNHELIDKIIRDIPSNPVYIHLDLDVMDPDDFGNTPLPVEDGLHFDQVYTILEAVDKPVGLGIYEYASCGKKSPYMEKLIQFGRKL
ncbi:MAG: arginase family protein [Faecalicoccus sp.]|nr:arginase family protein [Faecalicoccus sp.]